MKKPKCNCHFNGHSWDMCPLHKAAEELYACVADVLDADGDLNVMDFKRYREALKMAERKA